MESETLTPRRGRAPRCAGPSGGRAARGRAAGRPPSRWPGAAGSRPPDHARTASKRACPAAITSPMRMPDGRPGGAVAGLHQDEHGDQPHAHLDEQVAGQRPVGPVGLEQAAVEARAARRRPPQPGWRRCPIAAGLVEQHGHGVAAEEDHDRPGQDEHGALAVHPAGPAAHQVPRAVLVHHRHPAHHGHHDGGPGHGEDQVEPGELVEHPVAVRGEQRASATVSTTLAPLATTPAMANGPAWSRPARIDSTPGRRLGRRGADLAPSVGTDRVGRERHRRRHGFDDDLGRRRLSGVGTRHAAAPRRRSPHTAGTAGAAWSAVGPADHRGGGRTWRTAPLWHQRPAGGAGARRRQREPSRAV